MDIKEQREQLLYMYNSDLTLWTLMELFIEYGKICISCWGLTGPSVVSLDEMKKFKSDLEAEIQRRENNEN